MYYKKTLHWASYSCQLIVLSCISTKDTQMSKATSAIFITRVVNSKQVAVFNLGVFDFNWLFETFSALIWSINTDIRGTDLCKGRATTPEVHALLTPFICRYLLHARWLDFINVLVATQKFGEFKQRARTGCRMPSRCWMRLAVCFVNQYANSCQAERTCY